ncbi:hypothetical protein BDY24DRAFT_375654 [Mrakia frigida]|uniref:CFEM domain-containing protein n=1 Tax=Mrakia frigida TaxID=29902 RepID=UPI003FCC0328
MLFTSVLAALALPLAAVAQAGLDISSISPCIISCSTIGAAAGGCSSFSDYACICTSTVAQEAVSACLQANCTAEDVTASFALQNVTCATLDTASNVTESASGAIASAVSSLFPSRSTKLKSQRVELTFPLSSRPDPSPPSPLPDPPLLPRPLRPPVLLLLVPDSKWPTPTLSSLWEEPSSLERRLCSSKRNNLPPRLDASRFVP